MASSSSSTCAIHFAFAPHQSIRSLRSHWAASSAARTRRQPPPQPSPQQPPPRPSPQQPPPRLAAAALGLPFFFRSPFAAAAFSASFARRQRCLRSLRRSSGEVVRDPRPFLGSDGSSADAFAAASFFPAIPPPGLRSPRARHLFFFFFLAAATPFFERWSSPQPFLFRFFAAIPRYAAAFAAAASSAAFAAFFSSAAMAEGILFSVSFPSGHSGGSLALAAAASLRSLRRRSLFRSLRGGSRSSAVLRVAASSAAFAAAASSAAAFASGGLPPQPSPRQPLLRSLRLQPTSSAAASSSLSLSSVSSASFDLRP